MTRTLLFLLAHVRFSSPLVAWPLGLVIAWCGWTAPGPAQGEGVDLVEDAGAWGASTDRAGATMQLSQAESGLAVDVTADGGEEDFPKARLAFAQPQDWRGYARMTLRLRVTCTDPAVRQKQIALVFYDEETRLADYPGQPMKQQVISHLVPVNRWLELSNWLTDIRRAKIRQLDLYLYEIPPAQPHQYRWEVARLELQTIGDQTVVFDTQIVERPAVCGTVSAPAGSVTTRDGLELSVGTAGDVARITLDGTPVGASSADCPSGLLVRDATQSDPPVMVGGRIAGTGHELTQTAHLRELELTVNATYRTCADYVEIAGTIADDRGADRAVTVYLALPLADGPWQWWDSVAAARTTAADSTELSYLESGTEYGLDGSHSKYPLGAVTLPDSAGLTLAVRMDEPVVHRIAYNPRLQLFYLAIDFGLAPEHRANGRPLSAAPFRILLYRHDPGWGFRSALDRYYRFFPDFFTKRVAREGSWYVWGDMSKTAGALDAGFAFHWGPVATEAVQWDNAHGPLALFYIEPQTYQQTMEDFDRAPQYQEALERLRKLVAGDPQELQVVEAQPYHVYPMSLAPGTVTERIRATAQAVQKSLNHDVADQPSCLIGQFPWMNKSKWGAILSCNLAPRIPAGRGQFNLEQVIVPSLESMQAQGAHYDGIALDSLGGYGEHARANYRRELFPYGDAPLSFSAVDRRPVQVAAFTTVEWTRYLATAMHPQNRILMANCSWNYTPGWLTFAAPYLDVFGAEAPQFADPDFIRAIAYRKPCTDLPYDPRPQWEVPWHWLHAIHPGHGNDLPAMQSCVKLLRDLVAAGWEPITGARATPAQIRIERYGAGDHVYLAVHNPTGQATAAQLQLDQAVLGAGQFAAAVQPADQPAGIDGGHIQLSLNAQETVVIELRRE